MREWSRNVTLLSKRVILDTSTRSLTPHQKEPREMVRPSLCLMVNTLETGGSERQFVALVESLSRHNFDVHPACLRRIGAFAARLGEIPEFPVGGSLFRLQAQRARWSMIRSLRHNRIALAHSFDFYSNLMLIPAAKIAGVPVVIGSHRQLGDVLTPFQSMAQLWAFRFSDRIVCNSRAGAAWLRAAGLDPAKLEIIPNGIDESAFARCTPAIPRKPGLVRVGMIARMDPIKNHPHFLRAAARLRKSVPGVEFVLVGDGPLRRELEAMASQLGIAEQTTFMGERHDIPAVLASLDVSVLVSSSESLSNVILESMAAEVATVATEVGGNSELLTNHETGILVPPNNEQKLVEALERLIREPALRAQYAARGKEFVRTHFQMDQIRRRYEQLYRSLLEEKTKMYAVS